MGAVRGREGISPPNIFFARDVRTVGGLGPTRETLLFLSSDPTAEETKTSQARTQEEQ